MCRTGWKALGFETYLDFLSSDIWKDKRNYVLKLRPICEKCRINKATQVHHLTYERCGNEKGEDLMAVCYKCHQEIHNE